MATADRGINPNHRIASRILRPRGPLPTVVLSATAYYARPPAQPTHRAFMPHGAGIAGHGDALEVTHRRAVAHGLVWGRTRP